MLKQGGTRRSSSKDLVATVSMLSDATTDHFPLIASVLVDKVAPTTKSIERRNFKALDRVALLWALESWPWSDVYQIRDPDKVSKVIAFRLELVSP
jgi:hypothetical protein